MSYTLAWPPTNPRHAGPPRSAAEPQVEHEPPLDGGVPGPVVEVEDDEPRVEAAPSQVRPRTARDAPPGRALRGRAVAAHDAVDHRGYG